MEEYDVVVIGGGGAGLNVAQLLGKYNLRVVILELKKDILNIPFHTLGSFINLDKFGLTRNVVASDITECMIYSRHVHFKKKVTKDVKAYILNKSQLHKELLEKAIANNVVVKTGVHVKTVNFEQNGSIASVKDEQNNEYFAKVFIDCSGTAGVISKQIGFQDKTLKVARGVEYNVEYLGLQNQFHLLFGKEYEGGYGWIFPLGEGRAIFGYGTIDIDGHKDLKEKMDHALNTPNVKKLVKKDNEQICGGTIPITNVKRKLVNNNGVFMGDSVSQVNPLVGEGYRFVLEAGLIAAPYIAKAISENNLQLLKGYEEEWNTKFYTKYKKDKFLQKLAMLASKSDIFSDLANIVLYTKSDDGFINALSGYTLAITS